MKKIMAIFFPPSVENKKNSEGIHVSKIITTGQIFQAPLRLHFENWDGKSSPSQDGEDRDDAQWLIDLGMLVKPHDSYTLCLSELPDNIIVECTWSPSSGCQDKQNIDIRDKIVNRVFCLLKNQLENPSFSDVSKLNLAAWLIRHSTEKGPVKNYLKNRRFKEVMRLLLNKYTTFKPSPSGLQELKKGGLNVENNNLLTVLDKWDELYPQENTVGKTLRVEELIYGRQQLLGIHSIHNTPKLLETPPKKRRKIR